jgi:hypothetical protein
MDQVEIVVDVTNEIEAMPGIELPCDLGAAIAVEQHVPVVGVVQTHGKGREEDARGHTPGGGPVGREPVHAVEHATGHRVHHLEDPGDLVGGERLQGQLARGALDDRMAPGLEETLTDPASAPGGLDLEGDPGRGLGVAHIGCRESASGGDAARHGLEGLSAGSIRPPRWLAARVL